MLEISCAEMKAIDNYAIDEVGIPSIVLMENAALKVIENIPLNNTDSYTIVCVPGNNGGDGLAIARHLLLKDKRVNLFVIGAIDMATEDFRINLNILENMKVNFTHIIDTKGLDKLDKATIKNKLTIDAIFGIGLSKTIEGLFYKTVNLMNTNSKKILAVDLPSGLDGDTGKVLGIAVKANQTICFHEMKKGLTKNIGYSGEIIVEDIDIPKSVTELY